MSPSSNGRGAKKASKKKTARRPRSSPKTGRTTRSQSEVTQLLGRLRKPQLSELYRYWSGDPAARPPAVADARRDLAGWMTDGEYLLARIEELPTRELRVLEALLEAPRYERTPEDLAARLAPEELSPLDVELALGLLERRGLAVMGPSRAVEEEGQDAFRVPVELGDALLRARRRAGRGIYEIFSLRGHLDRMYDDPARARRTPPSRVRELYKLYSGEAASVARIERLPEGLRDLVQRAVLEFGGILPRRLFDRMETELPHWNGRRWGRILEESLVGTVQLLDLAPYGIRHNDETLIVFNEVTLAWLKRVAVPGDPDAPHDEAGLGVDLVSNISRFLAFIIDNSVRFTVRGEIFKTTEKRILADLIPNPGRELEREEVLSFIYRFARQEELIESTGERTFSLTRAGREWEEQSLDEKLSRLLEHVIGERGLGGRYFHQSRMRALVVSMLRRVEPGVWYDIMYLPFLARGTYLCRLDEVEAQEYFAAAGAGGHGAPGDDLQRMAWHLVRWVRQRLYLLGLVDLGYDAAGHPVAMRLTRVGARTLGMAQSESPAKGVGNLIVTPDFEVVLFPSGDDAELIHDLDRFCEREARGDLKHFRITERSLKRALAEGMGLGRMIATLELNARTPVPQNVLYTLRDWAGRAGLLRLDSELVVHGSDPQLLHAFMHNPGVKAYVDRPLGEGRVKLQAGPSPARMRSLLRELGFLVELEA